MTARSATRGHKIVYRDGAWLYASNGMAVNHDDTPCTRCGRDPVDGHDACLGTLPGVTSACCGHGDVAVAHITFTNGITIEGFRVTEDAKHG